MGRWLAVMAVLAIAASCWGCSLGPRNFRKINHPAPLVRARAISLGYGKPDALVTPSLVNRLDDPDVVVRLAAHEELKQRTGKDFGYVPWAAPEERAASVSRWHAWLSGRAVPAASRSPRPRKSLPRPSPQTPGGPSR
jgi:hypothetical protein